MALLVCDLDRVRRGKQSSGIDQADPFLVYFTVLVYLPIRCIPEPIMLLHSTYPKIHKDLAARGLEYKINSTFFCFSHDTVLAAWGSMTGKKIGFLGTITLSWTEFLSLSASPLHRAQSFCLYSTSIGMTGV